MKEPGGKAWSDKAQGCSYPYVHHGELTPKGHHRAVFPKVLSAPTLIRAETSLCLFLCEVPDAADLTLEGSSGQALTPGSAWGWMLWQDAGCYSPCVLRIAFGPM